MSLFTWYAARPRTVNSQFMFLLALVGACTGGQEPHDAGRSATTVDDGVSVTRAALGGHCSPSAIVEIDTCQELQNMELDLCGRYELTADLDCSTFDSGDGGGFRPVGQCWPWDPFAGDFDGNGHVISGLTIDRSGTNYVGLFGCITDSEIRDVGLEDASIAGGAVVGSIAGVAYTTEISRVYATGTVTGSIYYVGGLVGWLHDDVVVTDAYAQVQVTANGYCGLAFGKSYVAGITNVYASGSLTGCDVGLVGIENDAVIAASFFDCTVAGNCTDGLAETTSTLQTPSHYATAGWDLDAVWGFSGPSSYPCLRWQTGCGCQPTAATDADCDGLDDDCSGEADEDFSAQVVSCGVGACAATGSTSCVGGEIESSCQPGTPAPSDSSCDGIDSDCSGAADEDFVAAPTSCGVGTCASTGASACTSGSIVETCTPGTPGASDATCNGLDDNCNGTADEGFASFPTSCGAGACLAFGTTFCAGGSVQSTCEPGEPLGADALCDGVDDDCDGTADEGFVSEQTFCGGGECAGQGAMTCLDGEPVNSCLALCEALCADGLDDDLDTLVDCNDDECWGSAECAEVGSPCDDDDDCALLGEGAACSTLVAGGYCTLPCDAEFQEPACPEGTTCVDTICMLDCEPDGSCALPDHQCDPFLPTPADVCWPRCPEVACLAGTYCNEAGGTCIECAETDASCDGVDDDCNGSVDEDFTPVATECGFGPCTRTGVEECIEGELVNSCAPAQGAATDATCNGIDDDCSGEVDEDFTAQATDCGVGACSASGLLQCQNGAVTNSCTSAPSAPDDASCNATDDDCDGAIDEDFVVTTHGCGIGACAATGSFQCMTGTVQDTCAPGLPKLSDAACDGIDNDCNGAVDEDFVPSLTGCGEGQCFATGHTQCSAGVLTSSCEPGEPSASDDATCDGNDDDCDGDTDEDYAGAPSSCGLGACVTAGAASTCLNGEVEPGACTPLTPGVSDQSCNGIDDDCDGQSDEGYVAPQTQCGAGACIGTGQMQCTAGSLSDTCTVPLGAATDTVCDGIDEDCDGDTDEDFALVPTSCGIGACAATGALVCSGGSVHDSCEGGAPAASDATCDGDDDDCDTLVDEDFVGTESECGVGECAATGWSECVAGELFDSCEPETGALSDGTCDGDDDDCDGEVDEDHVPVAATCGVGACSSSGLATCVDGALVSSCQAGTPGTEGSSCDAIDSDCDGALDETVSDDGDPCTVDTCAPSTGVVTNTPATTGSSCSDGNPCDGEETCQPSSCPANMLAFWKGENNANDSATSYHGTAAGPVSYPVGTNGRYFSFPVVGSRVNLGAHVNALNFSGPATLDLWINSNGTGCRTILSIQQDATREQALQIGDGCGVTNGLVRWRRVNGASSSTVSVSSTNRALLFFGWHHLALTFDGTTTTIFIDGVQQTATVTGNDHGDWGGLPAPTEAHLGVTWAAGRTGAEFVGGMDEVSLYTRALSGTEIAGIYNAGIGNKCAGSGGAMACIAGAPPSLSDSNPCTVDACDPVLGITHSPEPTTASCSDGSTCTLADHCDGAGQCVASSFVAVGTACSDGLSCSQNDACTATGTCVGTPIADANLCTIELCDPVLGSYHVPAPAMTACTDGQGCTTSDQCNGSGTCVGTPVVPDDDGNQCTVDLCSPTGVSSYIIRHDARVNGATCNDGNVCNGADRCVVGSRTTCLPMPSGAIAMWPFDGHWNDVVGHYTATPQPSAVDNGYDYWTFLAPFETWHGEALHLVQGAAGEVVLDQHVAALNTSGQGTIELFLRSVHADHEVVGNFCRAVYHLRQDDMHEQMLLVGDACTSAISNEQLTWISRNGATVSVVAAASYGGHTAVTFDGTTTRFYADGTLVPTIVVQGTNHGDFGALPAPMRARLGGLIENVSTQQLTLDEVTIYNRALSAAEVADIANSGLRKCWTPYCYTHDIPPATDDENACTADSCDPLLGVQHAPLAEDSPCWVGDHCSIGDCNATGQCENVIEAPYCSNVGQPCELDTDCGNQGDHGVCLTEASSGIPGGLCTLPCDPLYGDESNGLCPSGTLCVFFDGFDGLAPIGFEGSAPMANGCIPSCLNGVDCGRGDDASCYHAADYCQYHCRSDSDCAAGSFCDYHCNGEPCPYMPGQANYDGSLCVVGAASETVCADRRDDDADSFIDCGDSDCFASPDCGELCFNNAHDDADEDQDCEDSECSQPCERCYFDGPGYQDGVDEDLDGLVDCDDPDCQGIGTLCVEGTWDHCSDQIDNDTDGLIDCTDPECAALPGTDCYETPASGRCIDVVDNDGDGDVDCADADCAAATNCFENTNARCRDAIDNDEDGETDCYDSDCAYDPPSGRTVVVCTELNGTTCTDDRDNDVDGFIDCLDPGCPCYEDCDDGADNDGNFFADCEDLDACLDAPECAEDCFDDLDNNLDGNPDCDDPRCELLPACEELCSDGIDNNYDGRIDCADRRCDDAPHCEELSCSDGLDNELDGRTDCVDSDCRDLPVADATCNRVDEDCDGQFDEDFVGAEVTCGIGACFRESRLACILGAVQNTCTPHSPSAETCDGIDNDCDGFEDEVYPRCESGAAVVCNGGVPSVTVCNDGDVCNGLETCAVGGTCLSGVPLTVSDGDGCTFDSCDPVLGVSHQPMDEGDPCDDGDYCTAGTTCDELLSCAGGTVVGTIDDGNPCTADVCDPEIGPASIALPDGASCADEDACNGEELCVQGLCTVGAPLPIDDGNDCTTDACDAELGITHDPRTVGVACEDGNPCTTDTSCDATVACTGGIPTDVDDQDPCTADSCDPQSGLAHAALPTGASCSNDDVCDGVELCMVAYEHFIPLDPKLVILGANPSLGAHSLQELGLEPGQRIELRSRGEFSGADMRREPFGTSIVAVFTRLITSPTTSYEPVAAGLPSYVALSRAIAGDFVVPAVGLVVTVPATATHLHFGIDDNDRVDNTDVDQDLGVELRTVLDTYDGPAIHPIDPASTFLESTDDDRVVGPAVLSLDALGIVPGDQVDLRAIGDWTRGHVGSATAQQALLGVFSSSNVVLPRFAPARVSAAIGPNAPPFETTADIAEDFLIPQSGAVVTVPAGASWLIVGVDHDTQWPQATPITERVDGDGDFGLVIQKHGATAAGCIAGTPLVIDDAVACTVDSCDPVTGPSHTPASAAPTCAELEAECGQVHAGCGTVLECGACAAPEVCGGQQPNRCGPPALPAGARIQVAREVNVAAPENGGLVVEPPSPDVYRIVDSPINRTWYALGIARGPRTFAVELAGEQAPVIDHVSFEVSGGYPHTVEVWAAETSDPSQLVLLGQHAGSHGLIAHQLSFAPTRARLAHIVVRPSATGTWTASVDNLRVFTRARHGGVVSLAEGGAQVLFASSSTSSSESPYDAIDFGGAGWRSPSNGGAAFLTARLSPEPVWVDQLELRGNISPIADLGEVALDLSTRTDGSQLETVIEGAEIASSGVHVIDFEPTLASSARLRLFPNTGIANASLHEARLYSQRLGGAVVPFNDATPIASAQIASWAWDFGDGETSTEQHPLHTYASPGTYDVSLIVTGTSGAQSIARTSYTVLEAPAADFVWEPLVVEEGGAGSPSSFFPVGPLYALYDRSVAAADHRILQRAWSSGPNAHIEAPQVSENANSRIRFLDDGAYDVTLTVLDSQLLQSARTQRIDVVNVPPTVEAGTAVSGIWGLSTRIGLQTSVSDQGLHDHENLLCRWDFGDGHTLDIPDCAYAARTVAHTYQDAGTYAASLTVFDDDTSTTDTVQVVQNRRFAAIVPEPLEVTAEDGVFIASARLLDALSYEPIAGRSLRIGVGDEQHVVVTDAAGYASTSLHFMQLSFVTVEYAFEGDARYDEALLPIDYLIREGDTEPQPTLEPTAGQESTRFVIGFPQNYYNIPYQSDRNFVGVMITSQVETNAVISIPGLGFSESVHVLPGQSMAVDFPVGVRMGVGGGAFNVGDSGRIEDKGVEIESEHPISVYGFDFITFSTDGFSAIPVDQLGTDYFALAYSNEKNRFYQKPGGTQVGIVATEDDTEVTITPTEDVAPGPELPNGAPKGVPFTVVLDRLETFQIVAHAGAAERFEDLTGTHISSTKPIAVLGGHVCIAAGGNSACNHLVEQLPPTESWGTRFITGGMRARAGHSGRPNGEYLRVLAASDDTEVSVDGELVATLARGEHAHLPTGVNEGHEIVASKPVLVAQYIKAYTEAHGFSHGARQDPFMAIVPAVDQYSTRYELAVAEPNMVEYIADRYQEGLPPAAAGTALSLEDAEEEEYWSDSKINIIAPSAEVGGIRVDGQPVAAAWFVIGGGEYAMARIPVETGHHRLSHAKPGVRFAAFAYGFNYYDGFGYPAGMSLGRRACEVSTPRPLDGIDNDCDGIRDEELLNGVDDDGDGVEDEDLNAVAVPNRAPEAYSTEWRLFNAGYLGGADRAVTERFALPGFDADGDALTWTLLGNPSSASISGNIVTVPAAVVPGTLRAVASDGVATSAEATLFITRAAASVEGGRYDCETNRPEGVRRLCNQPPYVFGGTATNLTIPIPSGQVVQYTSRVHAHDLDKDEVRYQLRSGPEGLEVDPNSGIVRWAIDSSDVGTHHVEITCFDYRRGEGPLSEGNQRGFILTVAATENALPLISSTPLATAEVDETYSYQIVASDPEGGALQYLLLAGPPGMRLSPTGLITWTPSHLDVGTHSAAIRVVDAQNAGQSQRWTITVAGSTLRIVSSPPLQATSDEEYAYAPQLVDDSGGAGPYEWLMLTRPLGMTMSPSTGRVAWTPAHNQLGRHITSIQATGADGAVARQYFPINVEELSRAPEITSEPPASVVLGGLYLYDVNATDYGHLDVLEYELVSGPPDMVIDSLSGVIQWIPDVLASETVRVRVTDTSGLSDLQTFVVTVEPDTRAPTVWVTATPERAAPGQPIVLTVQAADNAVVASRALEIEGLPVTLNSGHQHVFSSMTPGVYVVTATATDASGNVGTSEIAIGVTDAADTALPEVSITQPADNVELTYIHDIVASASDANLIGYRIQLRRSGSTTWRTIQRTYTRNASGVIGQLDTTLLENGFYELRIVAEDANGQTQEVIRSVRVSGQAKVGVVTLDFVDAVIPAAGIPIVVGRNYDSRFKEKGDFGYGWRLTARGGKVEHNNLHPGKHWFLTRTPGAFDLPCTDNYETKAHLTEVKLSEKESYVFRPVLVRVNFAAGQCEMAYEYELVDGSQPDAELSVVGNNLVLGPYNTPITGDRVNGYDLVDKLDDVLYEPQRWHLALADGRNIQLDKNGIRSIEDSNGNVIAFNEDGIVHSDGGGVLFERDLQGRISRIVREDHSSTTYGYDLNGDLVRVTDAIGDDTQFTYHSEPAHHLDEIRGPDGKAVAALEYDGSGRLARSCDGDRACVLSQYDLVARSMTQLDATSRLTEREYDTRGNVTSQTNALGHTTTFAYDDADNLTRAEGPDGSVATYTYDARGNMLTRVLPHEAGEDPADFTYTYTYNTRSDRETVTLPSGGVIDFDYDAHGNLTATKDGAGNVIESREYYLNGKLASRTDRFGTVHYQINYAANGQPREIIDSFGEHITFTYDLLGNLISRTERGVTTTTTYDGISQPLLTDYGNGATVEYEYRSDRDKRWTAISGPTFGRVERAFDGAGRIASWKEANGDEHRRSYDAAGRVQEEIDALGNRTTYAYDLAGRLESITDVTLDATTTFERDSSGRAIKTIDALGNETTTSYQVGGRLESTTNGRGYTTAFDREPTTSSITDALLRTTVSNVSSYGLPMSTSHPGGSNTSSGYLGTTRLDGAQSFPTSFEDELLRERSFAYDARSGLSAATDLAGEQWEYAYTATAGSAIRYDVFSGEVSLGHHDGGASAYGGMASGTEYRDVDTTGSMDSGAGGVVHHLSSVSSPLGETTQFVRGEGGRIDRVVYPDGEEKVISYDERGLPETVTLPQGTTLAFEHDDELREVSRTSSLGEHRAFTYGPGDRVETMTDATGTTDYEYDVAGRFSGIATSNGGVVRYVRDKLGRVMEVRIGIGGSDYPFAAYSYDENGNLEQMTEPTGATNFVYDEVDRLVERTLPNGVTSRYEYDERDRIESIVHRNAMGVVLASVAYQRSASGEPTRIEREDGSYVVLTYDAALRVDTETYYDASDTLLDASDYEYDADGNRTSKTSLSGGYESYTYEAGFKLASVTTETSVETYGYDDGGRQISVTRNGVARTLEYNSDDKVTRVVDDGVEVARYAYDGAGRRVRSVIDGVERQFVVAPNVGDGFESPQLVLDGDGAPIGGYAYAGEHPVGKWSAAGWEYYLQDAMGSVIGMANAGGASTANIKYDSFGNVTSATGAGAAISSSLGSEPRYHGMQLDVASGLYHVRARTYDARTGRFTSRDPFEGHAKLPESKHPYAFANGNPHVWVDPSGEESIMSLTVTFAINVTLATIATARFVAFAARAAVTAAAALCSASLIASAIVDAMGVDPPAGACTTGRKILFHYTPFPARSFDGGVWAGSYWSDVGTFSPEEAFKAIGKHTDGTTRTELPKRVLMTLQTGNFIEWSALESGYRQWRNILLVPRYKFVIYDF